jgi:hypothetical protein
VLDPEELFELADAEAEPGRPVLIQARTGFVDAGGAARLARTHLRSALDATLLATFDIDQLLDYRSRRPPMIFMEDHWEHYEEPELVLHRLRDAGGTSFLLLTGPEPDLHWERFIVAVIGLIDRFDVRLTVGLNSIPMAVPHTRPTGITAHATRRDLISGYQPWLQRVQVPAGAGQLLEYRLGQRGYDALGFAAHVPHYLADSEYPAAAERLLAAVSRATGLLLPTEDLSEAAAAVQAAIDRQVEGNDEVASVVRGLEQQYDAFVRGTTGENLPIGESGPLPTAEELGAELERFLAEQSRPDDPSS